QILSNAEENTLARWITRATATGFTATLKLIKARHSNRVFSKYYSDKSYAYRPRMDLRIPDRHPNFKVIYSRKLESARYKKLLLKGFQPG
ncbi:hypothetical protein LIPSTDRAFT_334721, partial [Lipomyces starkeyi NRRL Y-11557]